MTKLRWYRVRCWLTNGNTIVIIAQGMDKQGARQNALAVLWCDHRIRPETVRRTTITLLRRGVVT